MIGRESSSTAFPASLFAYSSGSLSSSSSSSRNSFRAVSRHAPKWYSSNTTRSQLISRVHSCCALMPPASFVPRKSWNDPKHTIGRFLSAAAYCSSSVGPRGSFGRDTNCQPLKSTCEARSSSHADSTAGLNVRTSIFFSRIRFASWYVANVFPKRIFAFQRNFAALPGLRLFAAAKYAAVLSTASRCSRRIGKSSVRARMNPVRFRAATTAARTVSTSV